MLSVIVCLYNEERALRRCVDSVLSQSDGIDMELLLLDDGSKDSSLEICDEIARKDKRVKVVHQENQGICAARRNGVVHASGDFVTYLDADDAFMPGAMKTLDAWTRRGFDFVIFGGHQNETLTRDGFVRKLFHRQCQEPFNKLYRRSLIADAPLAVPNELNVGEDLLLMFCLLKGLTGNIPVTTERIYDYTKQSETSIQRNFVPTYDYERKVQNHVRKALYLISPPISVALQRDFLGWRLMYLGGFFGLRYPVRYDEEWIEELVSDAADQQLTYRERLAFWGIRNHVFRLFFVAEKRLKRLARKCIDLLRNK